MNRCRILIPLIFPYIDFALQLGKAFDSSVEALSVQYIQLNLSHIQPAAMLRRIVYLQLFSQPVSLIWLEAFVK